MGLLTYQTITAQSKGGVDEAAGIILQVSFYLLLAPVFFPLFQKVYDAIVVSIVVNCCRKKFNMDAAIGHGIKLLLAIPSALMFFLGGGGGGGSRGMSRVAGAASKMGATCKALVTDRARSKKQRAASRQSIGEALKKEASSLGGVKSSNESSLGATLKARMISKKLKLACVERTVQTPPRILPAALPGELAGGDVTSPTTPRRVKLTLPEDNEWRPSVQKLATDERNDGSSGVQNLKVVPDSTRAARCSAISSTMSELTELNAGIAKASCRTGSHGDDGIIIARHSQVTSDVSKSGLFTRTRSTTVSSATCARVSGADTPSLRKRDVGTSSVLHVQSVTDEEAGEHERVQAPMPSPISTPRSSRCATPLAGATRTRTSLAFQPPEPPLQWLFSSDDATDSPPAEVGDSMALSDMKYRRQNVVTAVRVPRQSLSWLAAPPPLSPLPQPQPTYAVALTTTTFTITTSTTVFSASTERDHMSQRPDSARLTDCSAFDVNEPQRPATSGCDAYQCSHQRPRRMANALMAAHFEEECTSTNDLESGIKVEVTSIRLNDTADL